MYVKIGPFVDWLGPYQIAEKILFWIPKYDENFETSDTVHNFGTWLATKKDGTDTLLHKFCIWVHSKKKRKVKIKIDSYDYWSADSTMAMVILPLLKELQKHKHGSPLVSEEDVPYELQHTGYSDWSDQKLLDFGDKEEYETQSSGIIHDRWTWVLNEIIWTFEQLHPESDWEDQYHSGVIDISWEETDNPKLKTMGKGPKDTHKFDIEGYTKHSDRIANGLRLFGKYYRGLWD